MNGPYRTSPPPPKPESWWVRTKEERKRWAETGLWLAGTVAFLVAMGMAGQEACDCEGARNRRVHYHHRCEQRCRVDGMERLSDTPSLECTCIGKGGVLTHPELP